MLCPRNVLKRMIQRAADSGFAVSAAFEYEFFLFEETPQSVRDKGYRDLRPITPGGFGYSVLRSSVWRELYDDILSTCEGVGVPLEGLHEESGAGVLEAAITVDDALEAADRAVLFKTFVKTLAQRRGLLATFMSRWSLDWPGQGGHMHLSLQDLDGRSVFHDGAAEGAMSPTMRHFVAGQQALLPDLLAMTAPTVNSYTAARSRLLGTDVGDVGDREPDLRAARRARLALLPARRVPPSPGRTPIPISPSPRRSAQGFTASRASSSWARR